MVGVSVVSAPVMDMATTKGKGPAKPAPLPRGAARDLYRMICALSGACERDSGVLRDGALVDSLELQAKRILRARRGAKTSLGSSFSSVATSAHRLSTSPLLTAKVPEPSSSKISKRRKLPIQDTQDKADHRFGYDKSPLTTKPFKSLEDDEMNKASICMARADGSASLIPSVKIDKIEPYLTAMSGDVVVNSAALSERSPSTSPIHMDHLVKPSAMARRPSRQSLDLGASMASTVSSFSMHQYDMSDSEDLALTPSARYASTRTPYDYDHYARSVTPSSDLEDSFSGPSRRKGSCYSDASNSPVFGERGSSRKLRFEMNALSLYEKETSIKEVESGLVDTLQSQVDLLLTENVKALSENARLAELSQMSASEAEAQAAEKLLVVEQVKQQSEKIGELEMKYLDTKQRAHAQEDFRREAEIAFQSELDTKAELVASLQQQVTIKDEEIGRLSKRVEDISGLFASKMREQEGARVSLTRSTSVGQPSAKALTVASTSDAVEIVTNLRDSNLFMDMELERMRASLLEKDREICNLYMHLSTKKKLIEEITKKFVQHMEEAAAAAKATSNAAEAPAAAAPSFSTEGVRFDLDMFLFKNVVDKQRRMEELTASLSVMDREVESLEARVAAKERENTQLRENQEFLTRSLQSANAQVCRIQAEKEQLSASVQEHQTRITALVSSLEDKDREVEHLTEQVDLRQTQIDHLMSSDKSSGRRSLKSSLLKVRPSFSASAVKSVSRNPKGAEKGNEVSERASFSGVSARRSSVTTMRSSLDWTDAHRPSVVMAQSEFAKTKRSSVFSDVFKDISSPLTDDEESMLGGSQSDQRSTSASYCASEINDDEELFNELFARA